MPDWKADISKLLAELKLPPAREAEIIEELAQHAGDRLRELERGGVPAAEARRITLRELGGRELLAGELRSLDRAAVAEPAVLGRIGAIALGHRFR